MSEMRLQTYFGEFGRFCFGCGEENDDCLHLDTYWDGDEAVSRWQPQTHPQGWPGLLQGGVIAVLMDCTMTSLAFAHACRGASLEPGSPDTPLYVTASLKVDYRKPTPMEGTVELRSHVVSLDGRKLTLSCSLRVDGVETAHGQSLMLRMDGGMG